MKKNLIAHNDWKDKYLHKIIDVDKRYGGQCVDVARSYMAEVHGVFDVEGVVGAVDFFRNHNSRPKQKAAYFAVNYQAGMTAPQGALIVWGTTPNNSFGHIAVCDYATQTSLTVLEQDGFDNPARDVSLGDMDGLEKRTTAYNNVLGWLLPIEEQEEVEIAGALPPPDAKYASSDRTAQNGEYWLNKSIKPARYMLLVDAKWQFLK